MYQPSKYAIKRGYIHHAVVVQHDDRGLKDTFQKEVYEYAATVSYTHLDVYKRQEQCKKWIDAYMSTNNFGGDIIGLHLDDDHIHDDDEIGLHRVFGGRQGIKEREETTNRRSDIRDDDQACSQYTPEYSMLYTDEQETSAIEYEMCIRDSMCCCPCHSQRLI